MEPYQIALIVVGALILIAAGVIVYRNTAKAKERKAQRDVANAIKDCEGIVYRDYKVDIDGDDYNVDMLFIGEAGLFVVKVLTQTGKIIGDNMSKEWRAVTKDGEVRFPSPVKERERLTCILREAVPTDYQIYACVVFMNADLKNVRCNNVLTFEGLKKFIKSRPKMLSQNKRDELKKILDKYKKENK